MAEFIRWLSVMTSSHGLHIQENIKNTGSVPKLPNILQGSYMAKLNCQSVLGVSVEYSVRNLVLSSLIPFPCSLSSCHELSIFVPPQPSIVMLLPWSQTTMD